MSIDFPLDGIAQCLAFLHAEEIERCLFVCKKWRTFLEKSPHPWLRDVSSKLRTSFTFCDTIGRNSLIYETPGHAVLSSSQQTHTDRICLAKCLCTQGQQNLLSLPSCPVLAENDPFVSSFCRAEKSLVHFQPSMGSYRELFHRLRTLYESNFPGQAANNVFKQALFATSTDQEGQSLGCTLTPNPVPFWSSSSCREVETQILIYATKPNTLLSDIEITFYQELRQTGFPIYSCERIRFSFGSCYTFGETRGRKCPEQKQKTDGRMVDNLLPKNIQWMGHTKWLACQHTEQPQRFSFGCMLPFEFVQIELAGPRTLQVDFDNQPYICIREARAMGLSYWDERFHKKIRESMAGQWVRFLRSSKHVESRQRKQEGNRAAFCSRLKMFYSTLKEFNEALRCENVPHERLRDLLQMLDSDCLYFEPGL